MTFQPQDYCRPEITGLTPYQPGQPVEQLQRELGIRDSVKLASNENLLGPGEYALEALRSALGGIHFYPDGGGFRLKELLADRHRTTPDRLTLGNGSNELLELVARCFLGRDRSAVYSQHGFAVYPLVAQAAGAASRVAQARPAADAMPYGHDLEAMSVLAGGDAGVVFIANPNNPTGTWLGRDELRRFLERVPEHTVVVIDQAYAEYVTVDDYPDAAVWLDEFPNLVVTHTFSKIFALAGLRIGYALSSPGIAGLLNRLRQPFNVNLPAQHAAAAALGDRAHIEKSIAVNAGGLARLRGGCESLGFNCIPSVANFICVEVGGDAERIYHALLRRGVIVRPVANYGLPRHLRVTVGRPEHNARFLDEIAEVAGSR